MWSNLFFRFVNIGFFLIFFFVCARSLTKAFFCLSQPGPCARLSPLLLCADCTSVLVCVRPCMCMWKCVGKLINIQQISAKPWRRHVHFYHRKQKQMFTVSQSKQRSGKFSDTWQNAIRISKIQYMCPSSRLWGGVLDCDSQFTILSPPSFDGPQLGCFTSVCSSLYLLTRVHCTQSSPWIPL